MADVMSCESVCDSSDSSAPDRSIVWVYQTKSESWKDCEVLTD